MFSLIFNLLMLTAGSVSLIFGGRLLFQKGYVEKLRQTKWKDDSNLISERTGYLYDKYKRGIFYLWGGILFVVIALLQLLHIRF